MLSVRIKCAALGSLLFLSLFLFGTAVPTASAFRDSSTTWPEAQQSIAEMSAAGLVNGYKDGTFMPDNNVSKLEVVALLVRALGLEEQAKSLDKTTVDYEMPKELFWGKGYLITGVQRGMLDKNFLSQLKPAAPANRVEVAVLIFHALNLSPDNTPLSFDDAAVIPEAYQSCVAAVVKNKIMVGLPGNVFKPNDYITRAQMAVLLSRLIESGMTNPYPGRWVTGTLVSYDSSTRQATVALSSGTSVNKTVDESCTTFNDGKVEDLSVLAPGQQVRMVLDNSGKVTFLRFSGTGQTTPSGTLSFKGRVESIWLTNGEYNLRLVDLDGRNVSYKIASGTMVYRDGEWKDFFDLGEGDFVEIKVLAAAVNEILLLDTAIIEGEVLSTSSSRLKVEKSNGDSVYMDVSEGTVVEKDGSSKSIDDIKTGSQVEVVVYDDQALKIDIQAGSEEGDVSGKIQSLDTTGTLYITIEDSDGDDREYVVVDNVDVERDGDSIDFEDLEEDETVAMDLDSSDRVTRIVVTENEGDASGEIQSLDTTGTLHITIQDSGGDDSEYTVDDGVDVYRDGDRIDFEDLDEDEYVVMELDSDDQVTRIEVKDESGSTVSGTVTALSTGSSPRITIEKSSGSETRYYFASGVKYYRNGSRVSLSEIPVGAEVELTLESGDVNRLEITDDEDITLEGEITDLSTSRDEVTIQQDSGNEFTYELGSGYRLSDEDGDTLDLSDLSEGWTVEIRLSNGDIYRLEVTDK